MNLLDLFIKIVVKDDASREVQEVSTGIMSKFSAVGQVGAAAFAAISAAVVATSAVIIAGVSDVAAYGDAIDKMSQKMGMSSDTYQEWDAVMRHSGTSIETMRAGMKTLANAVENGNDAFQRIGLTQEQIAGMSQEDLFAATITGLQNVENETERTYLAGQLLGRGATELGALLNTSAEDTQAMRDRVHELGGVMSEDAVKASAAFQDSLQDMQTAFRGIKNRIFSEFLPSITSVMDGMQEIAIGNYDEGFAKIGEGVSEAASKLGEFFTNAIPAIQSAFVEIGSRVVDMAAKIPGMVGDAISTNGPEILDGLVGAFRDALANLANNLPSIMSSIVDSVEGLFDMITGTVEGEGPSFVDAFVDLVLELVDALADNWPAISDALIEGLGNLVETIGEHGPEMLEAFVGFLTNIVSAIFTYGPIVLANFASLLAGVVASLLQQAPKFLAAAAKFVGGLIVSVAEAVPKVLSALVSGIGSLVRSVISGVPSMLAAGREFINGMKSGITSSFESVKSFFSGIPGRIKSALGDTASILFNAGSSIINGLLNGIRSAFNGVRDFVSGIGGWIASHKGPLDYDRRLLIPNGKAIMQSLGQGLQTGFDKYVTDTVDDMSDSISKRLSGTYDVTANFKDGVGYSQAPQQEQKNVTYILQIGDIEYNTDEAMREAIDHWFEVAARRAGQYGIA